MRQGLMVNEETKARQTRLTIRGVDGEGGGDPAVGVDVLGSVIALLHALHGVPDVLLGNDQQPGHQAEGGAPLVVQARRHAVHHCAGVIHLGHRRQGTDHLQHHPVLRLALLTLTGTVTPRDKGKAASQNCTLPVTASCLIACTRKLCCGLSCVLRQVTAEHCA
ncbi:hypothetical protein E2C01_030774 [Portunus trituberculatus]|uniref:Uncharacterized protein n=1 Tax=Portunus trituberculatus TaxID=210409 RepID=A0A5B7ERB6_PORTR|nr:hypothetical protein [Portunus trituberculatus]